jgi:hypothetical protein
VRAWVLAAAAGNLLLVSLFAVHGATAALPLPDSQNRILRETHGFRELAAIAAELDAPVYADRYQDTAMLRFYAPGVRPTTTQWPGMTRPSEYLRGQIAPKAEPETIDSPLWLLSRRWQAPEIPGLTATTQRTLFDCAGKPLAESAEPPCRKPLHVWHLYGYGPDRPGD